MLIIGHRGASDAYPENTLEAFAGAAEQGADGVELDLRRTLDGRVAIRHDPRLPDGRLLADLRRRELPSWVPTLEQALAACAGFEVLNLEIKNGPEDPDFDPGETLAEAVVDALDASEGLRSRVLVSSFHMATIDRVRNLDSRVSTGWLTLNLSEPRAQLELAAARGHVAVHPYVAFVDATLVALAHEVGLAVNTWTVDDPDRLRELAGLGVDAAITNVPDRARAALTA